MIFSRTAPRMVAPFGFLLACSFQTPPEAPPSDEALQALIRASMHSESQVQMDERLKELSAVGGARLVPQLLYYGAAADSMPDAMAFGIIVDALHIDQDTIVGPLIPFLASEDSALRAEAKGVLAEFEGASYGRPPDFEIYRTSLQADVSAGKTPNVHLVQHLFEVHPGAALLLMRSMSMLEREESRALLWAEHVVANAVWKYEHGFLKPDEADAAASEQLSELSQSPTWWARLYVAQIMHQNASLRDARVVAALEHDKHELVRQVFAQE